MREKIIRLLSALLTTVLLAGTVQEPVRAAGVNVPQLQKETAEEGPLLAGENGVTVTT